MVSKAIEIAGRTKKCLGEQANESVGTLSSKILQLKKQIQADRFTSIKDKLDKNGKNLKGITSQLLVASNSKGNLCLPEKNELKNMLSFRIENSLCKLSGCAQGFGEKDYINGQEVLTSTIIKLPYVEKIPPYTTWIFLDKNQRMAEDQSVVGRRRIYYDQYGSEALICSDSEEEIVEPEEEKHEFSVGEDQILWMAFEEHGLNQDVLTILSQFIGGTTSEIQERYNSLKEKYREKHTNNSELSGETKSERSILSNKSLSAALDSFDNLFCRRCLVFDCRLHGCSQTLITPSEKQSYWCDPEEDGRPCSDQCYLRVLAGVKDLTECPDTSALHGKSAAALAVNDGSPVLSGHIHGTSITPEESFSEGMTGDNPPEVTDSPDSPEVSVGTLGKRKVLKLSSISMGSPTPVSDDLHGSAGKKQKKMSVSDLVPLDFEGLSVLDGAPDEDELQLMSEHLPNKSIEQTSETHIFPGNIPHNKNEENIKDHGGEVAIKEQERKQSSNSKKEYVEGTLIGCEWKPIEKELYLKGIEIFGRNSCLIARNLLSGLKTCLEVSSYMHDDGASLPNKSAALPSSFQEDPGKADMDFMEQEMPVRSRIFRRRGRTRKLKYSWKSAGHPSFRKRIADGKHQSCKQYTPCGCQYMCGKDCTCLHNGTCCEKYCGCSKSCKNRFRGCHCAKSQCRSRQCPCFAAGRECDPDVCRNCWVTCGDGSLGEPPERGDSYQCGNMRLFLKQQQRILLAKSDVAGWGAFIKNPVNKNDYLGEYTGELISHREADKRGKIYDRANSSFLFDLNDQYVLDAYRKGDKLKFANHSSNPNCYAKVMLVAGDHRVGIFAKEHIEASEELFYDYRYGPDQAPLWARRPEGSKRDDSLVSHGRAQKHQSH